MTIGTTLISHYISDKKKPATTLISTLKININKVYILPPSKKKKKKIRTLIKFCENRSKNTNNNKLITSNGY